MYIPRDSKFNLPDLSSTRVHFIQNAKYKEGEGYLWSSLLHLPGSMYLGSFKTINSLGQTLMKSGGPLEGYICHLFS
jgi:hypothetical protein